MEFAERLECREFWQLEAAAMLSQLGYISLPAELVEKIYCGEKLTAGEATLAAGAPKITNSLLENVARLEAVIQILLALDYSDERLTRLGDGTVGLGARILGLVLEYDTLLAQGNSIDVCMQTLRRHRSGRFTARLIEQFALYVGAGASEDESRQLPLRAVQPGMIIMQDVRSPLGTLLVPRGFEVTPLFVDRLSTFSPELLREQVRVIVRTVRPGGPVSQ
jgi:hypothetical protein